VSAIPLASSPTVSNPAASHPARDPGTFSPAVAMWMIAAALVSAAAFVALLAFGAQPRTGAYALSRSAVGYAALVRLLGDEGAPVQTSTSVNLGATIGVLVLTPDLGRSFSALPPGLSGHLTLVVTPKWATIPYPKRPGWVGVLGAYRPQALASGVLAPLTGTGWSGPNGQAAFLVRRPGASRPVLHDVDGIFSAGTTLRLGPIRSFQTFTRLPPGWKQGLVDEQGRTVIAFDRQRQLYVLSDPDLLNNQGLATLDAATAASQIFDQLRDGNVPVVFDLTLSGLGGDSGRETYNVLRLVLTPPFLPATLCGVAAALLMGLHAAIRFGPQRRAERSFALGKRALADNSAALIHRAGRDAAMAPRYAALSRAMALESLAVARDEPGEILTARLDRIGEARRAETRFSDLERDAARAADGTGLIAAAQALYRWRLEITRGR
jgi:hypothetical protein